MFERTLQDLIRGLRAHKASSHAQEEAFLAEAMKEIRDELRGKDMALKAEGVLKMCYLLMLYPIAPPTGFAFHVVETMSSQRYHIKQLGYMAAPMAFTGDTEEVVLTVNGIKKDLMSPHLAIPPLPLNALPHLLSFSPSLSHTLQPDILVLLTHSSPRIRKRAVLCLLSCWEAYPEGLREGFPRLRERLLDDDQGVVGATVSVVMELARRQGAKNYLPLAPDLFGILTNCTNNWILIKVVKLFALLTPLEPRLVRKLLPPITNLISSTSAISLLYECVRTCIVGEMLDPDRPEGEALARVCVEKLGGYLRDEGGDQNLRYIALLAMVKIIPTHPQMVAEYQDEVLESLDDADVSIRMRALELVASMVDRGNVQHIVDELLAHLAPSEEATPPLPSAAASLAAAAGQGGATPPPDTAQNISQSPSYRLLLSKRLLDIIAHDTYLNITDFEWVVSVLVDVAYVSRADVGPQIRHMLLDIVGRVRSVRGYTVKVLEKVLDDDGLRERVQEHTGEDGLLEAAVWICGEYSSDLGSPLTAISSILPGSLASAPPTLVAMSLQAAAKIFSRYAVGASESWSATLYEECKNLVASIRSGMEPFLASRNVEVQERAFELNQLFAFVAADLRNHVPPKRSGPIASIPGVEGGFEEEAESGSSDPLYPKSLFLFNPLFTSHELNSLAYKAQEAVHIPDGLDLDLLIVPNSGCPADLDDEDDESDKELFLVQGGGAEMDELRRVLREQEKKGKRGKTKGKGKKATSELTAEEEAAKARRKAARRAKAQNDPYYLYDKTEADEVDVDDIPIVRLDDEEIGVEAAPARLSKSKRKGRAAASVAAPPPDFDRAGEMPEGAAPVSRPSAADRPKSGLAAIEFDVNAVPHRVSASRYNEYTLDEDMPPRIATPQQGSGTASPSAADVAADEVQAVKVVKVKRKKKGTKKAAASAAAE